MSNNSASRPNAHDEPVRAEVVRELGSYLVQAPAGSGKTELLVQRYLRLLADVEEPEQVVAITFTRKAAAEMRNRVLKALGEVGGPAPANDNDRRTREWAERAAARAAERGWDVIENPARLHIRTVDSFCEFIVSQAPYAAGMGRKQRALDDVSELHREAARRTVRLLAGGDAALADSIALLLTAVDNKIARFERLMVEMLQRREQWINLVREHSDDADPDQVRKKLEESLADAVSFELRRVRATLQAALAPGEREQLIAGMSHAAEHAPAESRITALADLGDLPETAADQLPRWRGMRDLLFTKDDDLRRQLRKEQGFPPGADRTTRDRLQSVLARLAASPHAAELHRAARRLRKLPACTYTDAQWQLLRALFVVLPRAVEQLRAVFAERDLVDHTEIAQAALRALGTEQEPSRLAHQLGQRLRHILMDEFQDTSLLQLELLRRLTATWKQDDGRSLFLVGDPMQSIFSFRQAEVTLFGEVERDGLAHRKLLSRAIEVNFRSQARLVEWVNQTFAEVLTEDDALAGAVAHHAAAAFHAAADSPACEVHAFAPRGEVVEAEFVAETAALEEARCSGDENIAILVRARTHLPLIVQALERRGVRYRAQAIDLLAARPVVRDLLALTRALLHPADRIAWLAVLRAPWCGLTLADLWALCCDDPAAAIGGLLLTRLGRLSPNGQQRARRFVAILEPVLAQRGRMGLRRWVETAWLSLGGPAAVRPDAVASDLRDAATFLDRLAESEAAGDLPDLPRFEEQLQNLYSPPDTSDGIRVHILTIHGAKGLEFDVVLVPALERVDQSGDSQILRWYRRVLHTHDDLLLAPAQEFPKRPHDGSLDGYLKLLKDDCEKEEDKRLLYVAATRAKRKLYLSYTQPEHDKPQSASLLALVHEVAAFRAATVVHAATPAAAHTSGRMPPPFRRLPAEIAWPNPPQALAWQTLLPAREGDDEPRHSFEWVQPAMRHAGTVTHRFLQQIAREGLEKWDAAAVAARAPHIRAALLAEGVPQARMEEATAVVAEALTNTLADEKGRWLLDARAGAAIELDLSAELSGALRRVKLDRTFVEPDGTRWIVDYKTTRIQGGSQEEFLAEQCDKYRPDLERYRRVLEVRGDRRIRLGLYFPLQRAWRELEPPPQA